MKLSYFFVIPVQAGDKRRLRSRSLACRWIPACAGMTLRSYTVFSFFIGRLCLYYTELA